MLVAIKFFQKTFRGETKKEAYQECNSWIARKIIRREAEIGEMFWKVSYLQNEDFPTFKLELFATVDEAQFVKSRCESCQEFHKLFYINSEFNCDSCKMVGYRKYIEQKLGIKKQYRKEQLRRIVEAEEE